MKLLGEKPEGRSYREGVFPRVDPQGAARGNDLLDAFSGHRTKPIPTVACPVAIPSNRFPVDGRLVNLTGSAIRSIFLGRQL